jgi:hypothetical protein
MSSVVRSSRWVFLSASALTVLLHFGPFQLSGVEYSFYLQMPPPTTSSRDAPFLQENDEKTISPDRTTIPQPTTANVTNSTNALTVLQSNTLSSLGPIFYNVYIPEKSTKPILKIIQEQIKVRNETDPEAPILYTLIGSQKVDESIQNMCQPNCTQRDYLEKGNEIDTLQALWEYCHDNPFQIVTYIHDKGSFHPSHANRNARGVGTKGALACRGLMLDHYANGMTVNNTPFPNQTTINNTANARNKNKAEAKCSICAYRFYAFPVYHGRANMWTAHCSYIRNLLPPRKYETAVIDMHQEMLNHSILGPTKYACIRPYKQSNQLLGIGRYAMERWPFNHPHVKPCDSLTKKDMRNLKQGGMSSSTFSPKLTPAPQKGAKVSGIGGISSSWERLAGRLFEWNHLYHTEPPTSSWVWKYYKGYEQGTEKFLNVCTAIKEETLRNMTMLNVTINGQPLVELLE